MTSKKISFKNLIMDDANHKNLTSFLPESIARERSHRLKRDDSWNSQFYFFSIFLCFVWFCFDKLPFWRLLSKKLKKIFKIAFIFFLQNDRFAKNRKTKVHRSKGRALFIVYVEPSKIKLDRLRNKKYLFTLTYCFLSNPSIWKTNYLFWKNKTVHNLTVFYVPCRKGKFIFFNFLLLAF